MPILPGSFQNVSTYNNVQMFFNAPDFQLSFMCRYENALCTWKNLLVPSLPNDFFLFGCSNKHRVLKLHNLKLSSYT